MFSKGIMTFIMSKLLKSFFFFMCFSTLLNPHLYPPQILAGFVYFQAARSGAVKEARAEIEEIVNEATNNFTQQQNLGQKDQFGITALHYAVKYSNFEIVKLLVEHKIGKKC